MKNYKFSKDSYVSFNKGYPFFYTETNEYTRKFKIVSRKQENKGSLYELQEVVNHTDNYKTKILWWLWEKYKGIVYTFLPRKYAITLVIKFCFYQNIPKYRTPVLSNDIFEIGLRNFPRKDNYIQEDRLVKFEYIKEADLIPACNKNSCELLNNFLDNTLPEAGTSLSEIK